MSTPTCACGGKAVAKEARENIFLPQPATIIRVEKTTEMERIFTLRPADGSQMKFEPGQILEVGLMGYGEIPIGLASTPTSDA